MPRAVDEAVTGASRHVRAWAAEVQTVKQVENLDAKLGRNAFRDGRVFENREVQRAEAGAVVLVAFGRAERAIGRVGESRRIEPAIAVDVPAAGGRRLHHAAEGIAHLGRAAVVVTGVAEVGAAIDYRERESGVGGNQRVQLP